jgi:Ankyrin repeats (3 copies)/Ankyrin repeat
LKAYLTEWLQEQSDDSGLARDLNHVPRSILAELELDDWLEGRSPDSSQTLAQYQAMRSHFHWEPTIIYRLATLLPTEEFHGIITETLTDKLVESFNKGFTPAQTDIFTFNPEWAAKSICYLLGAGILPYLGREVVDVLAAPENSNVVDALNQAFPGMDVDLATTVLDPATGNFAVHILSQVGAASLLEQLLQISGVDINARNKNLETPLLVACVAGRFDTAMLLIEKGADVTLQNAHLENALHWLHSFRFFPDQMHTLAKEIMTRGSRELLKAEAKHRISLDSPEHSLLPGTPIRRAIIKGCNEASLLLWKLERDAFAPQRPAYGAITYAAQLHNHILLDTFLEGPADLVHPKTGFSLLLSMSFQMGSLSDSPIGRILRHGSRCTESEIPTLKVLCKYGAADHFASIPGAPNNNMLSLAVRKCSPETVEFLLKEMDCSRFVNVDTVPPGISAAAARGESVKYSIGGWKTSLLYCAMQSDRPRIFKLLLDHGADVNRVLGSQDGPLTTLHYSVLLNHDRTYVKVFTFLYLLGHGPIKAYGRL